MKIFQGTVEIAGQMGITTLELKKRGHISISFNTIHTYLDYKEHVINTVLDEVQHMSHHITNFFDIFHFHYGMSMFPDYTDMNKISSLGKPMIMHHWGNDVRFRSLSSLKNPYVYAEDSPSDDLIHQKLNNLSSFVREAIVQDYEVYPYVAPYYEKVHVVPIAINLDHFQMRTPVLASKTPLIIHAPTNPAFKGTKYIEYAIHQLREKYNFDYKRIEGMNHRDASMMYRNADIVIDQILCGSYGLFSVEAMALGKPVIAYIREDLREKFPPELPIINGNPESIYNSIEILLTNPDQRREIGKAGRAYVEKYHKKEVIVDQLIKIYSSLIKN